MRKYAVGRLFVSCGVWLALIGFGLLVLALCYAAPFWAIATRNTQGWDYFMLRQAAGPAMLCWLTLSFPAAFGRKIAFKKRIAYFFLCMAFVVSSHILLFAVGWLDIITMLVPECIALAMFCVFWKKAKN